MDGDTDTEADNTAEESGGGLGGGGNKEDLKRLGTLDDDALRALTQRSPNAKSSRFNFYVNFGRFLNPHNRQMSRIFIGFHVLSVEKTYSLAFFHSHFLLSPFSMV